MPILQQKRASQDFSELSVILGSTALKEQSLNS